MFLTILLVVSLIFAVSCPSENPTAKITAPTGDNAAITVTVGGEVATKEVVVELTDDTFNEEAFNVTTGNETDLSSWFTSSDATKATVSAKIKSLEEAATTKADEAKKYVKATVELTVTPVAATAENVPVKVAFKIPAVTGEAKKWTTSGKELTAENAIAITVNPKPLDDVTASADDIRASYNAFQTGEVTTITLVGATFKNPTPALPKSVHVANNMYYLDECSYSRDASDPHKVSATLKTSQILPASNNPRVVTISISADELTLEEGYKLPENFSVSVNLTITSA